MFCPQIDLAQKNEKHLQTKNDKSKSINEVVCYYWLTSNCKNGDNCTFLHEDIPEKYPECKNGIKCSKPGCLFKHIKREQKECHAYNSGYCSFGKQCKDLHNQKNICLNYLLGFCPEGPNCQFYHFKTMITPGQDNLDYLSKSIPNLEQLKG